MTIILAEDREWLGDLTHLSQGRAVKLEHPAPRSEPPRTLLQQSEFIRSTENHHVFQRREANAKQHQTGSKLETDARRTQDFGQKREDEDL